MSIYAGREWSENAGGMVSGSNLFPYSDFLNSSYRAVA